MPRSWYSYDDQNEGGGEGPTASFTRLTSPASSSSTKEEKPCRTCTDFKSWIKNAGNRPTDKLQVSEEQAAHIERDLRGCPLDKDELGQASWKFLHTMAANYPSKPSPQDQSDLRNFVGLFAKFYPCAPCAEDLREDLKKNPVQVESGEKFSLWACEAHNRVNQKLGKDIFDCSKVYERWRDGWKNGSCD